MNYTLPDLLTSATFAQNDYVRERMHTNPMDRFLYTAQDAPFARLCDALDQDYGGLFHAKYNPLRRTRAQDSWAALAQLLGTFTFSDLRVHVPVPDYAEGSARWYSWRNLGELPSFPVRARSESVESLVNDMFQDAALREVTHRSSAVRTAHMRGVMEMLSCCWMLGPLHPTRRAVDVYLARVAEESPLSHEYLVLTRPLHHALRAHYAMYEVNDTRTGLTAQCVLMRPGDADAVNAFWADWYGKRECKDAPDHGQ